MQSEEQEEQDSIQAEVEEEGALNVSVQTDGFCVGNWQL